MNKFNKKLYTLFIARKTKRQAGFSLIELAIALLIIGLLIGGVMKGKELIENARLKKVMMQVNEIRLAVNTFMDTFDALPGDFDRASLLLRDGLINGNGNGIIEGQGLAEGSESLAFWSHLTAAGLLPSPGTEDEFNIGDFGKGAPQAAIGGGFTVEHHPNELEGLWIVLGRKHQQEGKGGLLTPAQAYSINKKMDNGHPNSGRVRVFDGQDVSPHQCITSSGGYNLHVKEPVCILYFQI